MSEIDNMKEVYYSKYCSRCEYVFSDDYEEPCYSCLEESARPNSHKPINFEEAETCREMMNYLKTENNGGCYSNEK